MLKNNFRIKTNCKRKSCRTSKTFRRKIDANSEIVKAKSKALLIYFPSADINLMIINQMGLVPKPLRYAAKAAKSIAKGAIVTSEHIN
jgi:hypothetical protein